MFHSRRLASVGLGRKTSFNILQSLIVILFSAYLFSKAITTDCHQDDSRPFCSRNFPNYSLLTTNGSGPPTKSKLNIFSIRPKFSPKSPNSKSLFSLILILSGNIETNPGPKPTCPKNPGPPKPTWPCGTCQKDCPEESDAIECDGCRTWFHQQCVSMQTHIYVYYGNHSDSWNCFTCGLPNLSSRFFDSSTSISDQSSPSIESNSHCSEPSLTTDPQPPFDNNPIPVQAQLPNSHSKDTHQKTKRILGLNTLVINFQSLWNKRVELSNLADDTKSDIIIGTETWLIPEGSPNGHKDSELLLDGYEISRRDRPTTGGGVLIAIKSELCREELYRSKDSETIFCKINLKGRRPLIIGSVYRPPDYDFENSKKVAAEIYKIVHENKDAVFWIGGDFNVPDINWENQDIPTHQYSLEINSLFLEMAQDLGLSQVIDTPTRGTSFLDLLFSNRPDLVKNCKLLAGLGDHEAVRVQLALQVIRKKPTKRRIQLWNRVDETKLKK